MSAIEWVLRRGRRRRNAIEPEPELTFTTGLINRLRSDTGITLDTLDVTDWADMSPVGDDWTQATGANRPSFEAAGWSNGLPTVRFTRTAVDHMDATLTVDASDDYTVFAALNQLSEGTDIQFLLSTFGGSQETGWVTVSTTTDSVGCFDGAWRDVEVAEAGEQILTWHKEGTLLTVYRDGVSLGTSAVDQNFQVGGVSCLGAYRNSTLSADMHLAEMLVYNDALGAGDLASVHEYMMARYMGA